VATSNAAIKRARRANLRPKRGGQRANDVESFGPMILDRSRQPDGTVGSRRLRADDDVGQLRAGSAFHEVVVDDPHRTVGVAVQAQRATQIDGVGQAYRPQRVPICLADRPRPAPFPEELKLGGSKAVR
jgi:hypothetical protein